MAVTLFETIMIFLGGRKEGGNFLCVQTTNGSSDANDKLKHVPKRHSFLVCITKIPRI